MNGFDSAEMFDVGNGKRTDQAVGGGREGLIAAKRFSWVDILLFWGGKERPFPVMPTLGYEADFYLGLGNDRDFNGNYPPGNVPERAGGRGCVASYAEDSGAFSANPD